MRQLAPLGSLFFLSLDNEPNLKRRVTEWLERVGMSVVESKRCEELSKGMQQKIQFVAAVIHKLDLLILDEPFAGLDPVNQRLLRSLVLEEHGRGATVLFSTHIMVHAEQLCDHVVMIHKGEKMLDETISGIRTRFDPRSILFEPLDPSADLAPLNSVEGVVGTVRDGRVCTIALGEQADPARVIPLLAAAVAPARIELKRPSLEEIFVTIVEHEKPAADEERLRQRASLQEDGPVLEARK
jgi:ABC-2 type transport system ATP-binding protein